MNNIPIIKLKRGKWKAGISDGLTLPCGVCGVIPKFDYIVDGEFWNKIVNKKDRLGVVCLECLDKIACKKGKDLSSHLLEVQFTGIGKTIVLIPKKVYQYEVKL